MNMEKKTYYYYESDENGNFSLKEKHLPAPHRNCFLTKEDATLHFQESERLAIEKYDNIISCITALKEKFGDFSYDYNVFTYDDTGLEITAVIAFTVNGYEFRFVQS